MRAALAAPASVVAFALALAGCRTRSVTAASPPLTDPASDAATPLVVDASATRGRKLTAGALLTSRTVTWAIDAAPAAAPSKTLPMGSIFVAASTTADPFAGDSEVAVFEWDVATERVLRTKTLPRSLGDARAVRIARTTERIYVAVEVVDKGSQAIRLFAFRHDLSTLASKPLGDGEGVSLEATERHVVVSRVCEPGSTSPRLAVTLLDPSTLREIAHREIGGLVTDAMTRTDHLELGRDRVFVAGTAVRAGGQPRRSADTGALAEPLTVFALGLPTLDIRATYTTVHSGQLGASLIGHPSNGHIYVHRTAGDFLELNRNAILVASRELAPGSLPAFSSRGELFEGGNEDARAALFGDEPSRCVPLWSGPSRLLVCGVGEGGLRVVRIAKGWPPQLEGG